MKKILLTLFAVFMSLAIFSTTIKEIKSITGGTMTHEFNRFINPILRFEDRLFVNAYFSINEFKIKSDGSLEKISFFETQLYRDVYIDGNRLYCLVDDNINGLIKIFVFDISISPMKKIAIIATEISSEYIVSVLFNDSHILISDIPNERMALFNKSTFDVDGYIGGIKNLSLQYMAKSDTLLIMRDVEVVSGQAILTLTFYHLLDENTLEREEISSIPLVGIMLQQPPKVIGNKVVFPTWQGAMVLDIEDVTSPSIEYFIPWEDYLDDVLLYEDLLFLSVLTGRLEVYRLDGDGEYTMIFEDLEYYGIPTSDRNMYISYPYLYMNCSYTLKVYDISDDFNIVFTYGKSDYLHTWHARQNDAFVLDIDIPLALSSDFTMMKYDIYSASKDMLVCTLYFDEPYALKFELVDDKLFVMGTSRDYSFFNIYQLSDQEPNLLHSNLLDILNITDFWVIRNKIYFESVYPDQIHVYHLEEYQLDYIGSFLGKIQIPSTGYIGDVLLNFHNRDIIFRDINNFQNILMTQTILFTSNRNVISHIRDGYFAVFNVSEGRCVIYNYDIDSGVLNMVHFLQAEWFNIFNGIITINASVSDMSEYFTIINGQFQKIGEKPDFRYVFATAFFPEQNKMVQSAGSGIWLYDIDYKVSEGEKVIPQPDDTRLLGNYPNPFNPETTISFYVGAQYSPPTFMGGAGGGNKGDDTHIRIDIYNIRGQRIKTLVDSFMEPGEHTVVWNGRDEAGNEVGSGVYFCMMRVDSINASVRRMVLLK